MEVRNPRLERGEVRIEDIALDHKQKGTDFPAPQRRPGNSQSLACI